eukprot:g38237.t1
MEYHRRPERGSPERAAWPPTTVKGVVRCPAGSPGRYRSPPPRPPAFTYYCVAAARAKTGSMVSTGRKRLAWRPAARTIRLASPAARLILPSFLCRGGRPSFNVPQRKLSQVSCYIPPLTPGGDAASSSNAGQMITIMRVTPEDWEMLSQKVANIEQDVQNVNDRFQREISPMFGKAMTLPQRPVAPDEQVIMLRAGPVRSTAPWLTVGPWASRRTMATSTAPWPSCSTADSIAP